LRPPNGRLPRPPKPPPPIIEAFPRELVARRQWVGWKYGLRGDDPKWTKVPYRPDKPHVKAQSNDPSTWGDFVEAWRRYTDDWWDGIGIMFSRDDPYWGVDFDKILRGGVVAPWAEPLLEMIRSTYGEISPSMTGVKFIGKGEFPKDPRDEFKTGKKRGDLGDDKDGAIEIYWEMRFFTLTGRAFCGISEVLELPEVGHEVYLFAKSRPGKSRVARRARPKLGRVTSDGAPRDASEGIPTGLSPLPEWVERQAIDYINSRPPSVEEHDGSGVLYGTVINAGPGFNLTRMDCFRLIQSHYNIEGRCVPPWDDDELWHKIDDAYVEATDFGGRIREPVNLPLMDSGGGWTCEPPEAALPPGWDGHADGPAHVSIMPDVPAADPPDPVTAGRSDAIFRGLVSAFEGPPRASLHVAAMGGGKTYAGALTLAHFHRLGVRMALAVETLFAVRQVVADLKTLCPAMFADDSLVLACNWQPKGSGKRGDEDDDDEGYEDDVGHYEIHDRTRTLITTHSALLRRGHSQFIRAIWEQLAGFGLLVDEASAFVGRCRRAVPWGHRFLRRLYPDGRGHQEIPHRLCPKKQGCGACKNCHASPLGGEVEFNRYGIPELMPPRRTPCVGGARMRTPMWPYVDPSDHYAVNEAVPVARNTWAARVVSYDGVAIGPDARRAAPILYFRKVDGLSPRESVEEVDAHLMAYARNPVLVHEEPVEWVWGEKPGEGEWKPVAVEGLVAKALAGDKAWHAGVHFPHGVCNTGTLLYTDTLPLEVMRRHIADHRVSVAFLGATPLPSDRDDLAAVFDDLETTRYPYSNSLIRQIAIVASQEETRIGDWIDDRGRPLFAELDACGPGLAFLGKKREADDYWRLVRDAYPECRLVTEDRERECTDTLIEPPKDVVGMRITHIRGVLGRGANLDGLTWIVLDANSFRAISSFNPEWITEGSYELARAQEREAMVLQALGRLLRGVPGHRVVLILLNADEALLQALAASPAIREACELPPIVMVRDSHTQIVREAVEWLDAGGDDWPNLPDQGAPPKDPNGRPKRSCEDIVRAAEVAIAKGVVWSEFKRKSHPERVLDAAGVAALKARFP
jgi:hypothetical protein